MTRRYIRTLIHVLSLVIRDQSSYSSIGYILVRLVCTQPTTLLTSTVNLVLSCDLYLPCYRLRYGAWLGRYTKQYIYIYIWITAVLTIGCELSTIANWTAG